MSGMKNRGISYPNQSLNLIGHAWCLWKEGIPLKPNMASVVVMLSSEVTLPQPKEPGFLLKMISIMGQTSTIMTSSINETSLELEAR
ncbi:hypothetical protein K1719_046680 [Acacia pycnantha]|nr:hypothetical protein K1719_046680 [Acacia pycnantha]